MPKIWSDYVKTTVDIAHRASVGVVVGFKARTMHLTKRLMHCCWEVIMETNALGDMKFTRNTNA